MAQQSATIEKVTEIALNTTEVIFKTSQPFAFVAGQYVTITLPALKHLPAKEQFRDFSIASPPEDSGHIGIAVRNSASRFKQELLRPDKAAEVLLDGPKGNFTLPVGQTMPVAFVAGGVGITPFLSMIRHIVLAKLSLKPTLFYYNRSQETAPYLGELERYGDSIRLVSVFGIMTAKEINRYLAGHPQKSLWYLAGPRGMVKAARAILTTLRVRDDCVKSEEFSGYA